MRGTANPPRRDVACVQAVTQLLMGRIVTLKGEGEKKQGCFAPWEEGLEVERTVERDRKKCSVEF